MEIKKIFERQLSENIETHRMLSKLLPEIDKSIKIINQKLKLGGKLLFCGNGGSGGCSALSCRISCKIETKS